MNIAKMKILFLSCLAFLVLACGKDKLEGLSEGDETCGVSFALKADYTLNEVVLTRSASAPADEEFKVRIENTRAEILKEWEYGDLPSLIKVVPGSYKLVGWFGSDTLLPAFERPYYYGETKITLKDGDVLDTIVPVKVAATKVAVVFDESFTYDYDDYFVDIKTVGDSLRFLKEETREGYFLPGKLRMRFGLKPKGSGIYYQFYPDAIASVKAKQFYKMTLKAQTKNGALSMISITTDSTTIDIPVEVDLPPFYLPKKAPVVTIAADEMEEGNVLTTEGLSKKAVAMITSAAGLTELKIKTVSDTLLRRGWPAEFDLMKATNEQKAILKANGLDWSEAIDDQDTIKTTVWVSFNNVVKLLNTAPGQTTLSAFEIHAKDRFDQAGNECKFGIKVAPPVFGFKGGVPTEDNIWAKKAIFDLTYTADREAYIPTIQYKILDGEWLNIKGVSIIQEGECSASVQGLNSKERYAFRAILGGHTTEEYQFTTEEELQLPNKGLENWNEVPGLSKYYSIWYADGWCTMNELTTSEGGTNDANMSNDRDAMAYCANSGTRPTTKCNSGSYGAVIRSVGWGRGSRAGWSTAAMKNTTAGELYLGTYDAVNGAKYGINFLSRPSSIGFYSQYSPYNAADKFIAVAEVYDETGEIIAEGKLSDDETGSSSDNFTYKKINLMYKDMRKKAAKISIKFVSGTCLNKNKTDFTCSSSLAPSKDFEYVGAQLYIDDIELIYE